MTDERAFIERLKGLTDKQVMMLCLELNRRVEKLQGEAKSGAAAGPDGAVGVVGMGCRFPGGGNGPDAFWRMLSEGRDAVREVPPDRWDVDAWYDPDAGKANRIACHGGGFLDKVDGFDAEFFRLSPREILSMDPQHRLLLEVAWEALEHAGIPPATLKGKKVGVFVGISTNDYAGLLTDDPALATDSYFLSGNALNFAAGRIAYTLGFNGPAVAIDTACSSSLVALHLAAQALQAGDCDLALAGGVNLILSPFSSLVASRARMLSPSGRCRAFDAGADGMVRGEGAGLLVLERAASAGEAGRRIWASVLGTAVNQDGTSSGITVPSRAAQEAVIRAAQARAGVTPAEVGFVEAHGTGTPLGDPIEAHALGGVFAGSGERFLLGSVKTNLGHLESAAGAAGLIKTILALNHGEAPPHLHLDRPSPAIEWDRVPADLPRETTPIRERDGRRLAGVSSFGGSGTNAHAVLAVAAEPSPPPPESAALPVMVLSARSEAALRALAARTAEAVAEMDAPAALAASRTAALGRDAMAHRMAVAAPDGAGLAERLRARAAPDAPLAEAPDPKGGLAFLFTGQGSQHARMGMALAAREPVFRERLERHAALVDPHLDRPVLDVLADPGGGDLDRTEYTQPALFCIQMALVDLFAHWGIAPKAVAGHSLGAFAAACVAGVMAPADAARLVALRGRLVERETAAGAMLAVMAEADAVAALVAEAGGALAVSARNAPGETVVTGTADAVEALAALAGARGLDARRLKGRYGFHSPLMDPVLDAFEAAVRETPLTPARLPVACSVDGVMAAPDALAEPGYWRRQLRETVDFAGAARALDGSGIRHFLEIGPGGVLAGLGRKTLGTDGRAWVATLRAGEDEALSVRAAVARLAETGIAPDWSRLLDGEGPRAVLPSYPFRRTRFWPEVTPALPDDAPPVVRTAGSPVDMLRTEAIALSALADPQRGAAAGIWLIRADGGGVADALAEVLAASGGDCRILSGDANVVAALAETPEARAVVHLGALDVPAPEAAPSWSRAMAEGPCGGLPAIVGALEGGMTRLHVVTRGAWPATPAGLLQAPVWPMVRTAALEHPDTVAGLVDLDPGADAASAARSLAAALLAGDGEDHQAFRAGARLAPRLTDATPGPGTSPDLSGPGLHLVIGGRGGIGRHLVGWLAARGARDILVLGRSPSGAGDMPAPDGVSVRYAALDVADSGALASAVDSAVAEAGPLRSVIHAAGESVSGPVTGTTREDIARLFAAKGDGLAALRALLHRHTPDLALFCSSVSASWGSAGLAAYGAANGLLDATAEVLAGAGVPALSVAWGPWQGTGLSHDEAEAWFARAGVSALSPEAALATLDRLASGSARGSVAIASLDRETFTRAYQARRPRPLVSRLVPGGDTGPETYGDTAEAIRVRPEGDRPAAILDLLRSAIGRAHGVPGTEIDADGNLSDLGLDSLMVMDVLADLQRALGLPLYPKDFYDHPTPAGFAAYLAGELSRGTAPRLAASLPARPRSPQAAVMQASRPDAVFLLSSPRSGSTLLRVMLAGHSQLFCPPELHLLPFETMADWHAAIAGAHMDEGVLRAVMERFGLTAEAARARVEDWVATRRQVGEVYRELAPEGRILVDKSPSYAADRAVLERAEALFARPLYVHLVRHPLAVMESVVRTRMDRMLGHDGGDAEAFAQTMWRDQNRTLEAFLAGVDPARRHVLRYEDLVRAPEAAMRALAGFIGVGFEPALLTPYEGERMTDGVHARSLSIGDPNFASHSTIDPALAETWRETMRDRTLSAETARLARGFGYDIPGETAAETDGLAALARLFAEDLHAHPAAVAARRRLAGLGIDRATADAFGAGFVVDDPVRAQRIAGATIPAGLAGRLVVPHRDRDGRVLAFLDLEAGPAAPLEVPFGGDVAVAAIADQGWTIALEGPLAVLQAHAGGVDAVLGGPLSEAGRRLAAEDGALVMDVAGEALTVAVPAGAEGADATPLAGSFVVESFDSASAGPVSYGLLLPPDVAPGERLPLLIMLPGAEAVLGPRLAALPDRSMSAGHLPRCAVAIVQAPRTLYLDPPAGGPKWESAILHDLPRHLAGTRPEIAAAQPALVGLSMGGLGVLRMALRHPDAVSGACALAPAVEAGGVWAEIDRAHPLGLLRPEGFVAGLFGPGIDGSGQWTAHHPPALAAANAGAIRDAAPVLGLFCGDGDGLAWDGTLYLHNVLDAADIPHRFERIAGGRHTPAFFAAVMPEALRMLAPALAREPVGA